MKETPSEESIKEVYASFGLAYFHSECLHRELCHAYALSLLPECALVTRPRFEEALVRAYSLTLGQVIEKLNDSFDQSLFDRLMEAVKRRNFLAHHFWFECCHLMNSEAGLLELQKQLSKLRTLFHNLDLEVTKINRPRMKAFGISDEEVRISLEATLAGTPMDALPSKRLPKKHERLVRVWDVPTDAGGSTLVFESGDGLLLGLCDVGLGWTHFERPEPSWIINAKIQRYLPTTVLSRPSSSKPWSYDFALRNGMLLSVRPSQKGISYRLRPQRKS